MIHVHNLHYAASPSVIYAVKHSKVPLVCTLHNYRLLCPSNTLFHNGQPFMDSVHKSFPMKAIRKGLYRESKLLTFWMGVSMQLHHWLKTWNVPDRYIVLSQHGKEIFMSSKLQLKDENLVVKPNFCSPPTLSGKPRSNYFVYIGRLSADKGVNVLLNSFSTSPYQLVIAGDGPLKEKSDLIYRTFSEYHL